MQLCLAVDTDSQTLTVGRESTSLASDTDSQSVGRESTRLAIKAGFTDTDCGKKINRQRHGGPRGDRHFQRGFWGEF